MRVLLLTCHNVYNCGASLQVYALQTYLELIGCEVEIVNYIPKYLDKYRLLKLSNPKFDKVLLKQAYMMAKFPSRLKSRFSKTKKLFDKFTAENLKVTEKKFSSGVQLENADLSADVWIVGSDQIWNPLFENGRDFVFFLGFVKEGLKVSYAASIGTHDFSDEQFLQNLELLKSFDKISVRERSTICDLRNKGIEATHACDPIFLLKKDVWESKIKVAYSDEYAFYYIFSKNSLMDYTKRQLDLLVHDYFENPTDPFGFVSEIYNAKVVVSNSFHATAFAILFNKEFYVLEREDEPVNLRMKDLLNDLGLQDRYVTSKKAFEDVKPIDWKRVNKSLEKIITYSRQYLKNLKKLCVK